MCLYFACTIFCDLYAKMVQGRQFAVLYITNVCEYKILCFKTKPQKYQTLVPAKYSHIIFNGNYVPQNIRQDNKQC